MSLQNHLQKSSFDGHYCCNPKYTDYNITYSLGNNATRTNKIYRNCIRSECVFDNTFCRLFLFQISIANIDFLHHKKDVALTKGRIDCNTLFEKGHTKLEGYFEKFLRNEV